MRRSVESPLPPASSQGLPMCETEAAGCATVTAGGGASREGGGSIGGAFVEYCSAVSLF